MLCYVMLFYAKLTSCQSLGLCGGVINMMVGDAQRVADCVSSCTAGSI